jgi:hypothetical protein
MDIQSTSDHLGATVALAMQAQMLAQMKAQGADMVALINSAAPSGSVNLPGQGLHVDVHA